MSSPFTYPKLEEPTGVARLGFAVHLKVIRGPEDYVSIVCRLCNRIIVQGEAPALGFGVPKLLAEAALLHCHENAD